MTKWRGPGAISFSAFWLRRAKRILPGGLSRTGQHVSERGVDSLHNPKAHFIDATAPFRQGDEFIFVKDGRLLYYDANHINEYGAQMLKDTLRPFFSHMQEQASR